MFSAMKLGRNPSPHDDRNLKLNKYLRKPALPTAPSVVRYSPAVLKATGYGMLLNDEIGDCVPAGMFHYAMQQAANDGNPLPMPSREEVLRVYSAISGYNPADPGTDRGCNILEALKHWKNEGILIGGQPHQIGAFAAVNIHDSAELDAAFWLFGGTLAGWNLPLAAQCLASWTNAPAKIRGDWRPGTWGGHCTLESDLVNDLYGTESWNRLFPTDRRFVSLFCDECLVVISNDWLGNDDQCPAGFDRAALLKDLEALG